MKRNFILVFVLSLFILTIKAQYVTIPDNNFRAFLKGKYPTCFNASDMMDTTCSSIINETLLVCNNLSIENINGIQYFKKLTNLQCQNNLLSSLPVLPNTVRSLSCFANQITAVNSLPTSIQTFSCSRNLLTTLPALPNTVRTLTCSDNQLTGLPTLSTALVYLDCSGNMLTTLPPLSSVMTTLACPNNKLTSLPALPSTLTLLDCTNNNLTGLPVLPSALYTLACSKNKLVNLPSLPNSISYFYCSINQIVSLPSLPTSLTNFGCSYNQITSLPTLPSTLINLDCSQNQIATLPQLPASLKELLCFKNEIKTLPSLPTVMFKLYCDSNKINWFSTLPDSLQYFSCAYNGLYCLPVLPSKLRKLFLDSNNSIQCLRNIPDSMNIYIYKNAISVYVNDLSFDPSNYTSKIFPVCEEGYVCTAASPVTNPLYSCSSSSYETVKSNITGNTYQWQIDTCRSGSCYVNLTDVGGYSGTNQSSMHIPSPSMPTSNVGFKYRCIIDNAVTSDVFVLRFANGFHGGIDNNWENVDNWYCNTLPDENTDVFIFDGNAVLNSNVSVRSITVNPNTSLTVATGKHLTVLQ